MATFDDLIDDILDPAVYEHVGQDLEYSDTEDGTYVTFRGQFFQDYNLVEIDRDYAGGMNVHSSAVQFRNSELTMKRDGWVRFRDRTFKVSALERTSTDHDTIAMLSFMGMQ